MPNLQSTGILADSKSDTGLLAGIPDAHAAQSNTTLRSMTETFDTNIADLTALITTGWTSGAIGGATVDASVEGANGFLLIDAGTTNNGGENLQANATPGIVTAPTVQTIGPITSTATLMDAKEIIFKTRLSFAQDTIASGWTSKVLFGWCISDTSLMAPTTGAATITTGGGFGFRIGTDGIINTFSQSAAVGTFSENATNLSFASGGAFEQTTAATFQHWIEFGCRARWVDASAATGQIDYFINKTKVATVTNGLPMTTTGVYSVSYEIINGAAADDLDMAIQSITTGITRAGD